MSAAALGVRPRPRHAIHRLWPPFGRKREATAPSQSDVRAARHFARVMMPLIGALMGLMFLAAIGLVVFVGARQNAVTLEQSRLSLAASLGDAGWRAASVLEVMTADPEVQAVLRQEKPQIGTVPEFRNTLGLGLSSILVQDRAGETVSFLTGDDIAVDAAVLLAAGGAALVQEARREGPGRPVSGYVLIDDRAFLLASMAIGGEAGAGGDCCAVFLTSQAFGRLVDAAASTSLMKHLEVVPADRVATLGKASMALPVPPGAPALAVAWSPAAPGSLLLSTVLPAMAVFGVVLACVTGVVLHRASSSARRLARTARALEAANAELAAVANTDGLTGLANRRYFDIAFGHEWRRSRRDGSPLALLMIDVDRFKDFNDRHGHVAGDERLQKIADVVSRSIRRPGDVAARYGGEEFAVLLPGTGPEGAMRVAETIRSAVAGVSDEALGACSVSIGVASVRPMDDYPALLLQAADAALYLAKNGGRNQVRLAGTALLTRVV